MIDRPDHPAAKRDADPAPVTPVDVTNPQTPAHPTGKLGGPSRRTLVVLGVLATIFLLVGAVALAVWRQPRDSPTRVSTTGLGAPADTTGPSVPSSEVQRIHTALHDMGARCTPGANSADRRQIGRDVDLLITFARTYPDARFTIDDENGQALDLLLIARDEMRTCAPAAAARANQALPAEFRTSSSVPPSAASGK